MPDRNISDRSWLSPGMNSSDAPSGGHACNCIGCCRDCGGCRTAPWHAKACAQLTALRREEQRVIHEAMHGRPAQH